MTLKDIPILLKGIQVYTEKNMIEKGYVRIKGQKIMEIGSIDQLTNEDECEVIELPASFKAIPGFIDVHIHGVNGADTMDATKEALDTMVRALPKEGTTSFLATTITQEGKQIERALINAGHYIEGQQSVGKAEILGLHLEGPFVNAKRAGAQPIQHIIDPDLALFKEWQELTKGNIRLVTLAPERPGGLEMIRYLKEEGIIASIGHTDATFEEVNEAIEAGANHVTHLFNQMRGLHHREPGVVGAAFLRDELIAEIIVDGVHVHPEMVKLAFKQKQSEGLILITDSMRAKCLKNGQYDLGGQEVTVKDGKAVLEDGTLAGSILKLGHAVKNTLTYTGCSLMEAIQMAAVNPAKQLNIYDRKGSITVGKDADIVIIDDNMEVYMTICRGLTAFRKDDKNEND
ncbi:N-acetylglucosamine-6-phosphate deacetylase [Neobacillus vireti]|uniref:N-acetylglucosamine-6-phosphate deacetylase n=1 Tax=Neobacillus vireti LMG 21834 TaxID=1131730 RepID=A0AB94IIH4_9BACI|nr:N-acetylglucosamine-6-phosphate deacetylase [Neobacillus vireti]ETI66828.1 N-acetylglucosamine-6-phosphate deacetylase [Neobacillus vireti LMG 21834]KLT19102.1 N-acetylglucosamine-6-phosphate deacetylase [Neobacillus vireti]